jgi:uncharacterized membrane protein YjgN (DUF898 family)
MRRKAKIVYKGKGGDIFLWCIVTGLLSVVTLGVYLPFAANKLWKYLWEHMEINIVEQKVLQEEEPLEVETTWGKKT